MTETDTYEKITFVGVLVDDKFIFDDKEMKIILKDIFDCVVKVENCVWLNER